MVELPGIIATLVDIPELSRFVKGIKSEVFDRVAKDSNIINDEEVAKAAHDALIPTGEKINWSSLSDDQRAIFMLVCKRLLAHFLDRFEEEKTVMILKNGDYRFRAMVERH